LKDVARAACVFNGSRGGQRDPKQLFLIQHMVVTLEGYGACDWGPTMMVDRTREILQGGVSNNGWNI